MAPVVDYAWNSTDPVVEKHFRIVEQTLRGRWYTRAPLDQPALSQVVNMRCHQWTPARVDWITQPTTSDTETIHEVARVTTESHNTVQLTSESLLS